MGKYEQNRTGGNDFGFTAAELNAANLDLGMEPVTPIPSVEQTTEGAFETAQVIELARNDLNFLAGFTMPTIFEFLYPQVFLQIWAWLIALVDVPRIFPQLALGLPRGFGKTTVIKLFIFFCIVFTRKKFILVVSSTATLAENIISDVSDMLNEPNVLKVFGNWKLSIETDNKSLKKFNFRGRDIILVGIGAGTSLRGLNLKNSRPDVMIFEDIQTKECAESQVQSDTLERWMYGTAMKAKSPHGCMFLFVGNMYPTKYSILRKLKHNPKWVKFIAGGILSDGSSLWEELQPIEQLQQEFMNDLLSGHPEIFYSEVLNDENASSNSLIDLSAVPETEFSEHEIPVGNFIIIDPSNDKSNSDNVCIGYFEVINAYPVCMEVVEGKMSPLETIHEAIKLGLKHNCRAIGIESNAYQYSLLFWFNHVVTQMQLIGFRALELYSGSISKNSRILTMFKSLTSGELLLHKNVRALVFSYITSFNPLRRDNVDGVLDLLTYAPKMITDYGIEIQSNNVIQLQEFTSIPQYSVTDRAAF
jgi:hypothetical protein